MIEPTDEMVRAFNDADFSGIGNADWEDSHIRAGLAAVLAIVERDRAAEVEAVADVLRAYRAARAKGYFRNPRGPVAWAVHVLDQTVGTP